MKILRKLIKGKQKAGGGASIFVAIIGVVALLTLFIMHVNLMYNDKSVEQFNETAKLAINKLETKGELNSTDIDELKEYMGDWEGIDDSSINISFNGDNSKASYGEICNVIIRADIIWKGLGEDERRTYSIEKKSVAKY